MFYKVTSASNETYFVNLDHISYIKVNQYDLVLHITKPDHTRLPVKFTTEAALEDFLEILLKHKGTLS